MKIKRSWTETLDIPDEMEWEDAISLLRNPRGDAYDVFDEDEDLDDDFDEESGEEDQ